MAIVDGKGGLIYANRTLCGMSGYEPPELYRMKFTEMLHPDDRIEIGSLTDERRLLRKDGRVIWVRTSIAMAARPVGPLQIITLLEDISEQKQAENALRASEELAEVATSQLAAIVQCSKDAIVATDAAGAIVTWNDGAQQLLGYTAAEAQALPIAALFTSADSALQVLSLIHHGQSAQLDEALFLRSNGSHVPVLLNVSPIRKSDGQLTGSAVIARDISARKQVEREMEHRALHDPLTGLPNRQFLTELLADSIASASTGRSPAPQSSLWIWMDLSSSTTPWGTRPATRCCSRWPSGSAPMSGHGDRLARMGGDEFMLVVNGVTEDRGGFGGSGPPATSIAGAVLGGASRNCCHGQHGDQHLSPGRHGRERAAPQVDAAMYEAKQAGKDRIRFYSPGHGRRFPSAPGTGDRPAPCARPRRAMPVLPADVHGGDNRQTACEALSRWPHPSLGFVPPKQFIPLAEETGLIVRLGEWVLREACRQCRWWQEHGKPRVRVAVNVSPLQFARADFVDTVLGVLRETGLSGDLLDLELTESIVMGDIDGAIQGMARLRAHGVRISVDDFGTGYSSLGYLPKLPVDILKIDRCFVEQIDENDAAVPLIHSMISLAHSIGKRVVVEGIETTPQLEILRNLGCDEVQGFLLGRPAPLTRYDERPREIPVEQLTA